MKRDPTRRFIETIQDLMANKTQQEEIADVHDLADCLLLGPGGHDAAGSAEIVAAWPTKSSRWPRALRPVGVPQQCTDFSRADPG